MKFSELVRLLEEDGFRIVKEKGSIRYYGKPGWDRLIRVDYHGTKEVPTGIESVLTESTPTTQRSHSLKGIWKGKGFDRLEDLEEEVKQARKELGDSILKREP